jgi:hypothetical protein
MTSDSKVPPFSLVDYPVLNPLQKDKDERFRADMDGLHPSPGIVVNASISGLILMTKKYNMVVVWPIALDDLKHEQLRAYAAEHKDLPLEALKGEIFYTAKQDPLLFERGPVEALSDDSPSKYSLVLRRMPSEFPAPDPDKPMALVVVKSAQDIATELAEYTVENVVRLESGKLRAVVRKKNERQ